MVISPVESCLDSTKEFIVKGLRKQILRQGVSWQTPLPGDEVHVHFSGQIEGGAKLDSSRDKDSPFRFILGQGEVIKGWDEGVGTMKKGERAIFTMSPNLAYGEVGCPPLIPPNSTLSFDIEMVCWSTIRDLTGDGGLLKKIVVEGDGWATPKMEDEVLVKYEVWLENGPLLCKSDGVEFHVGDGHLCPAISKAVKTMRQGEKAELAVKFSYGFQPDGNGATKLEKTVPSDSKLTIHLELLSWKSVIDITGDKKVLKKIIKAGEGFDRPNEGSQVKVICIQKLEDGTIAERMGSDDEPFEFTCLEEKINEGLYRAIMTMKKGEQALVTVGAESSSSDYDLSAAYSANSVLHYEVELIDFTKEKPFWKMETHEKIEACEKKKQDGNLLFKAGNYWCASKKYEKAARFVEFDHSFTGDEKSLANALWVSCNLNNAACKLKLGEYLEASRLCTKVLEIDPLNVKALYRRSQAYLRTSELEKAEDDIKRALTIDPDNRDVKLEYKELKDKKREYARYEAGVFSTMLSRMV